MQMKKCLIILLAGFTLVVNAKDSNENDTIYTEIRQDIVVLSSTKETNSLQSQPAAVSVFSPKNLESMQVKTIKDISAVVPNFFIPSYGSKMTTPLYIRGIGARTGAQTVSLYVDNIPYFNPSVFDFELFDIQRVEILRGTQGALYGRNSMGGIINIYTYSPLNYEGTNSAISGGNYGYFSANASHYKKLDSNVGIGISGYYKRDDGFFENRYTGKKADNSENAGGKIKFAWEPSEDVTVEYSGNYDFTYQGAFPYMKIEEDKVNFDGPSSYKRQIITNGLSVQYTQPRFVITSTTGYQFLNDHMRMDQDYTPASIFKINQLQNQHSLNQEFAIKSKTNSFYQWSNGIFGFYDYQKVTSPVQVLEDGIKNLLQTPLDNAASANPNMPFIKFTDKAIGLDGIYRKPVYGGAVFHQSTFNNILDERMSFTVGLRLDYEKTEIKYDAHTGANVTIEQQNAPNAPVIPLRSDTVMKGKGSKDYVEFLPKFVLKFDVDDYNYLYLSATKGYKTGGHNIQLFADLLQSALMNKIMGSTTSTPDINSMISYNPEYSWNYEFGGKIDIIRNTLSTTFAVYYIDVKDVQITQFAESGAGRMTTNAGKAVSKGFELGLKARPCTGFFLYANYGFADAKFKSKEYYMNKYISFAPRSTVSLGTNISYNLRRCPAIDRIVFDVNYTGVGKIYWTETNDKSQSYYANVNARIGFEKNIFGIEFWGKNIFDKDYQAFYFESMGNSFVQKGKPAQWGATVRMRM